MEDKATAFGSSELKKGGVGDRGARFDQKLYQVGEKDQKEEEIK